jgi:hypothetical protein
MIYGVRISLLDILVILYNNSSFFGVLIFYKIDISDTYTKSSLYSTSILFCPSTAYLKVECLWLSKIEVSRSFGSFMSSVSPGLKIVI